MVCYHTIKAWRSKRVNENGKRPLVFKQKEGFKEMEVTIPCGRCHGCRLDRTKDWAVRCMHEAGQYDENIFITLTYDDEFLPKNRSLDKRHFQLFMKSLRQHCGKEGKYIRFYQCGEYGDKRGRPHYHAIIFNYDFKDKVFYTERSGYKLWSSETLDKIWKRGQCMIGEVTYETAAYVAGYIMEKWLGKGQAEKYCDVDKRTGEIYNEYEPEYTNMSRKPGIGRAWIDKYKEEVIRLDSVSIRGKELKPPRYYDSILDLTNSQELAINKSRRLKKAKERLFENFLDRLQVREKVDLSKHKLFNRRHKNVRDFHGI